MKHQATARCSTFSLLWRGDAPPAAGPPPFAITQALAINSRGDILVLSGNFATGDQQYYVLSDGTFNPFQIPGAQFIEATGINTRGDIVGTYSDASGKQRGFLLSGEVSPTLTSPGRNTRWRGRRLVQRHQRTPARLYSGGCRG